MLRATAAVDAHGAGGSRWTVFGTGARVLSAVDSSRLVRACFGAEQEATIYSCVKLSWGPVGVALALTQNAVRDEPDMPPHPARPFRSPVPSLISQMQLSADFEDSLWLCVSVC